MIRWGQVVRTAVGVLLIPLCIAAALTFGRTMLAADARGWHVLVALLLGSGGYVAIYIFFYRSFVKTIFSNEPVAMLWSSVTGYRLPVEPEGAKPKEHPTDIKGRRVPLIVVIVPYLVPIYTVAAVLVIWIVRLLLKGGFPVKSYALVQAFALGLTYTFHLFLVSHDIREKNPNLRSAGYLFTLVLLFLVNVEIIAALSRLVFNNVSWITFNEQLYFKAKDIYAWFWQFNYNPFR